MLKTLYSNRGKVPLCKEAFLEDFKLYFPSAYDLKYLACTGMQGIVTRKSLDAIAEVVGVSK